MGEGPNNERLGKGKAGAAGGNVSARKGEPQQGTLEEALVRIGTELGGLVVHSCGDFSKVLDNLKGTPHTKGINAGQMTVSQLVGAGLDGSMVAMSIAEYDDAPAMFELIRKHRLRVCFTIDLWPKGPDKFEKPENWTKQDWEQLKFREARILEDAHRL